VVNDHELDEEILDQDRDREMTRMAAKMVSDLDSDRLADGHIGFDALQPPDWKEGRLWPKLASIRWKWNNWRSKRADRRLERGGWPTALRKAVWDPFDYACCLRSGLVIFFESASSHKGGWVHLAGIKGQSGPGVKVATSWTSDAFTFERGIDVRLTDIVWVADAPYGS